MVPWWMIPIVFVIGGVFGMYMTALLKANGRR